METKLGTITNLTEKKGWLLPLFLSTVLLLVFRKPLYILVQPGRVEDVDVLFNQALQYSWGSIAVVYNYYYHVIPRLVTLSSLHLLDISHVPLGMNLSAIVIAALCASFFASKQFRFVIQNDLLRILCSLFIVVSPSIDEIYSNISSIQWFLNVYLMLFTILLLFRYDEYEKKSKKQKCFYGFIAALSFLSSAFSVIFLPVLFYVIARALKNKKEIITILSCAIPVILLLVQTLTLYTTFLQQSKSAIPNVGGYVLGYSVNAFTISLSAIFYHNTPDLYQHAGQLMYLIPIAMIAFLLIGSRKSEMKLEIYILLCMFATLFFSSVINRQGYVDWGCLCGVGQQRYFSFTLMFAFILMMRKFDKSKSLFSKSIFLALSIIIIFNIASGFLIPSSADENWKYISKLYDPSGSSFCYIGEIPHGWAVSVPCSSPVQNNTSIENPTIHGPSVTFTPPILPTSTQIIPQSASTIYHAQATLRVLVSPTPDNGEIQITIDNKTVTTIPIFDGGATFSTTLLEVGQHQISASYLGAANFDPSESKPYAFTVLPISNLRGANLAGANLTGMDLSGVDLQGANLTRTDLQNANLSDANLKGTETLGTNFAGAIKSGCNGCP